MTDHNNNQADSNTRNEPKSEKPIDAIRRMNPGSFIPSGEELAAMAKNRHAKLEEANSFLPVTEWMIREYPHFENILAEKIFSQLDENSLQWADHVVGISGDHSSLVYRIVVLINEHREKYGISKSCTVLSSKLVDAKYISRWQALQNLLRDINGLKKQSVFVHYLFDHPMGHHNDAPWKYTEEAIEHWRASEKSNDKQVIKSLVEGMGCELYQSVILQVPRE